MGRQILNELNQRQIIDKSIQGKNYKSRPTENRYKRRKKQKMQQINVNKIDMNKLFKSDILVLNIEVTGETDSYIVTLEIRGFTKYMRQFHQNGKKIDYPMVWKALYSAFTKNDVMISCTCSDFYYRFSYQATKQNYNAGKPQSIPADVTNPDDLLGAGCKHCLLVITSYNLYLHRVAIALDNYIKWMRKNKSDLYKRSIEPVIGGEKDDSKELVPEDENKQ